MTKQRLEFQEKFVRNYRKLIDKLNRASKDSEYEAVLRLLIRQAHSSYCTVLRNDTFRKLHDFIMDKTKFLPDGTVRLSTRCWYVIHNRTEIVKCHNCGKEIVRDINVFSKAKIFWCGAKCQGKDKYLSKKHSKIRKLIKRRDTCRSELPPECKVEYSGVPIVYDEAMNQKLFEYYTLHKKAFWYWIDRDSALKSYLMEKSYPLGFTKLKVETRVKWVIDMMQEIPKCKTCGRQIDFLDVKMSHDWPEYCCSECKKVHQGEFSYDWHCRDIYGKMVSSKWTTPMFSLDEFKASDRKTCEFKVKCLMCGCEFELPFDLNFYNRNRRKSYFRCPLCFPKLSKRQMSVEEQSIFKYVKNELGIKNVKRGDRKTIYPFELDVHPMKEHSDFAVEYNGIFWHSLENECKENHILNKVKMCEDIGIRLLMIWEDEYLADREKFLDLIKRSIFDRDSIVAEITGNGLKREFEVDRMLFNKCWEFPGYELIGETDVDRVFRNLPGRNQVWTTPTAGKLFYRKCADSLSK